MKAYDLLDSIILSAISNGSNPLYENDCSKEALRISENTGRETFRIIDGRLQALRKAGKIKYLKNADGEGVTGWVLAEAA